MDILAAIFAYLVCITGLVTGLVMSFVVFFSAPGQFASAPSEQVAMVVRPSQGTVAKLSPVRTIVKLERTDSQTAAAAAKPKPVPPPTIAVDVQQKRLFSQAHLRRLIERQRAKQLAFRERSSFETRFLHFED